MSWRIRLNAFAGFRPPWIELRRALISCSAPLAQIGGDHFVATILHRSMFAATTQGIVLLLVGRFIAPRLAMLGSAYLTIAIVSRLAERRYGAKAGWLTAYILAVLGIAIMIAISGGIYSHAVATMVILTITCSFVIEIRKTLLILLAQLVTLAGMSVLQANGFWPKPIITPPPVVTWLLITQMSINFAIPIITTVQAHREALDQLRESLGSLRLAEEEARKLLETQCRLFWDVSHELRSPLTRLNLSVGKVRREAAAQAEPSLERMENEVARLNRLIHQLLLLAQLNQGASFPMNQQLDLASIVRSVCEDAEFEANVAGRDLRLELEEDVARRGCPLRGCAELLRSAFDNVIRNAIRFAPEGTEVLVEVMRHEDGMAVFSVADRGPGVPEGQIAKLFDPFFRVTPDESAPAVQRDGSGLGLAIAHESIRKHAGEIVAANRQGGGFLVTMRIPCETLRNTQDRDEAGRSHVDAPARLLNELI